MNEPDCPSCHTPLQRVSAASGLRFQCPACQGVAVGVVVFRRVLPAGVGSQVWVASAGQAATGRPCGFCGQSMRPIAVPADPGPSATVEICRICEVVWVPADQAARLPVPPVSDGGPLAEPLPPAAAPPPTRCPECGAPFEVAADGCCPYCRRQVTAPQVLVMHDVTAEGPGVGTGINLERGVLAGAALFALGALLGR